MHLLDECLPTFCNATLEYADDFAEVTRSDGTSTCHTGNPVASFQLREVIGDHPDGVSGPGMCALYCQGYSGCMSFNFRPQPLHDGTQCQLFAIKGRYESKVDNCRHYVYKVNVLISCKDHSHDEIFVTVELSILSPLLIKSGL